MGVPFTVRHFPASYLPRSKAFVPVGFDTGCCSRYFYSYLLSWQQNVSGQHQSLWTICPNCHLTSCLYELESLCWFTGRIVAVIAVAVRHYLIDSFHFQASLHLSYTDCWVGDLDLKAYPSTTLPSHWSSSVARGSTNIDDQVHMQPTALHSLSTVVIAGHCRTIPIRTLDSEFLASVRVLQGGTFLTQCLLLNCSLQILRIVGVAPCISWSWPTHSSAFISVSTLH